MMKECECATWCDLTLEERILTGHHKLCPDSPSPLKKAIELIGDMARGMESWASDEDGIHDDAWKSYCKAKSLEGIFLNPNGKKQ